MFKEHSYSEWNLDTISWIVFRVYAFSDFLTAKSRSLHLQPSYTRACVPRLVACFPSCILYIRVTCDAPFTCECARASIYMHNSRTYPCLYTHWHTRVLRGRRTLGVPSKVTAVIVDCLLGCLLVSLRFEIICSWEYWVCVKRMCLFTTHFNSILSGKLLRRNV